MGAAGYTLMRDGHVRVDIFYREASARTKALIDMIGCVVFIAPFVTVLTIWALPYVERSWRLHEGSANFGGMPGLYVLKSFLLGLRRGGRPAGGRACSCAACWCSPAARSWCRRAALAG